MAVTSFIPELWSKSIDMARDEALVFLNDCNREFEGEVKQAGDTVHILGGTRPTIRTLTRANAGNDINSAEDLTGSAVDLTIDQISYFNFLCNDFDKAQSAVNIMDAYTKEAGVGLASAIDAYVAGVGGQATTCYLDANAVKITADNCLTKIDAALTKLYEKNVPMSEDIVITVSPRYYELLLQKYQAIDTSNSDILKNGVVGKYHGCTIKLSNNVYTTNSGAQDKILVRTKKAIAACAPLTHTEGYRPDAKFADAVKGYTLYGAIVSRPDELVVINAKYTD